MDKRPLKVVSHVLTPALSILTAEMNDIQLIDRSISEIPVSKTDFSLQQACHKFVMTRVQACHKFVMTRVQACSKLTKASKSPWNELAASLSQAYRANSLQIIAKTEYEHNPG
ncbi:hypothetical protein AVEN_83004-1 [Araneus ventricosus]|uniref:Uncharacterized protein n=1 Tax=Araneus ventricosus TaxID=182803 RepID=A0A4Y2GNL4_ARAVE|nr:hypothetical protein AVEN_83004-1 [Araneus ventricosus]